jgi:RNA polymerase sigma factor (sigma-70 family)
MKNEHLVIRYFPWTVDQSELFQKRMMRRGTWIELDDLLSEAVKGLCSAAERFHGGSFIRFAAKRVRGAMQDYVRRVAHVKRSSRGALGEPLPEHYTISMFSSDVKGFPKGLCVAFDETPNNSLCDVLIGCLGFLTPRQRRILMLQYYADKSYEEIAKELGVSNFTICVDRRKALDTLHRVLCVRGVTRYEGACV